MESPYTTQRTQNVRFCTQNSEFVITCLHLLNIDVYGSRGVTQALASDFGQDISTCAVLVRGIGVWARRNVPWLHEE